MKFNVYDNGKLAQFPQQNIHHSWNNASFETLEEAQEYANLYFHPYSPPNGIGKIDYSGYGDIAEIRHE